MYAAVTTAQVQPDRIDEALRTYAERVIPRSGEIPGLHSLRVLVDRGTHTLMVVALYDTEASASGVGTSEAWRQSVAVMTPLMVSQPTRQVFEVALEA